MSNQIYNMSIPSFISIYYEQMRQSLIQNSKVLSLFLQLFKLINYANNNKQYLSKLDMKANKNTKISNQQSYITKKSKVSDLSALTIDIIYNYQRPLFKSDIGYYYNFSIIEGCHARRIKSSEIGVILNLIDPTMQYQKSFKIVQSEYTNIIELSSIINKAISSSNKNKQLDGLETSTMYKNIKTNYLLKYYDFKFDKKYGCYIFHQPIVMTLDSLIKAGTLSYNEKLQIFDNMLDIMQFLQSIKIYHRCITSYSFVFVLKDSKKQSEPQNSQQKLRYDSNAHQMKITGFYQSIRPSKNQQEQSINRNLIFENNYTDPNIYQFKYPQFSSDLWSVIMLFFQILVGKVPLLNKKQALEKQMIGLLDWQKDIFTYYFTKGTKGTNITLKDLRMRVKQMQLTSDVINKVLIQKKQHEKSFKLKKKQSIIERAIQFEQKQQPIRKRSRTDLFINIKSLK